MDVKLNAASIELRTMKLTRSLLRQFRRLQQIPQEFMAPALNETERALLQQIEARYSTEQGATEEERLKAKALVTKRQDTTHLDHSKCIGWVHGSVLKEETEIGGYDRILIFAHNGNGYIYCCHSNHFKTNWPKQLYIG